jgi:hypothetical protein
MVHYVLLDNVPGGVAAPGLHRAFTFGGSSLYASYPVEETVGTFIHETLHLLGASDKYNNNECDTVGTNDPFKRSGGTLQGSDIMCNHISPSSAKINDITAREIGWQN